VGVGWQLCGSAGQVPNVGLSGSGGDCETTTANPLLTLQIAPASASGVAAVRCSRG